MDPGDTRQNRPTIQKTYQAKFHRYQIVILVIGKAKEVHSEGRSVIGVLTYSMNIYKACYFYHTRRTCVF